MINEIFKRFNTNEIDKKQYRNLMYDFYINLGGIAKLIDKSDIKSIHIEEGNIIAEFIYNSCPRLKLFFNVEDIGSPIAETINFGNYEQEYSMKLIDSIQSSKVFFDIGANIGYYSSIAGLLNKQCKVFSFEPIPQTYEKLRKNITLNALTNVTAYNFGFLDQEKEIYMFFNCNESGAASLENIRGIAETCKTECKFTTIDTFVRTHKVMPDLIKIDIEGAELFALKGAVETLRIGNPILYIEILRKWCAKFGHTAVDVFCFLHDLGYSSYVVRGTTLERIYAIEESTIDTNFVFKK